jgi:hypothetical protein
MSRALGCAFAGALAITASVAAQNPPQTPPAQQPPATRTPATDKFDKATAAVTVEGCLMREEDVAGRKPNVAEKAGIGEDFILTQTKMIKGSAPAKGGSQAKAGEAVGTSGTRGASMMYEVEGISGADLKTHAGHRVQIDGSFENTDNAAKAPESKTPADDLVELRGVTIRQVAGECSGAK